MFKVKIGSFLTLLIRYEDKYPKITPKIIAPIVNCKNK